jgi:hypothetical protein
MRISLIGIFFIMLSTLAYSQDFYTVSGTLIDSTSGEPLIAATVFVREDQTKGAFSDENGTFSILLAPGKYTLIFNYFSYKTDTVTFALNKDMVLNIMLKPEAQMIEEIVLRGNKPIENIENTEMGKLELSAEDASKIPAIFGETDLMKTLQLLPGVQGGGEGNSGVYVRGGGPDQNLVLIDNAPVYNTGHLLGFFSVFNNDAISNVTLYKGNMPANYGGRISSVIDFTMKEPDLEKFKADGGIGLISSRLSLSAPIVKNKLGVILSGRRTYIDLITKPFINREGVRGVPYYFYDLNGKIIWKPRPKDHITLSSYYGKDNLELVFFDGRIKALTYWGNHTATLAWKHIFGEKHIQNLSLVYNKFGFVSKANFDEYYSGINSTIEDFTFKADYDYLYSARHKIKYGLAYTWHIFTPRKTEANAGAIGFGDGSVNNNVFAHDMAFYALDEFNLTEKLKFNIGLRYNFFYQVGPYTLLEHQNNGQIDTLDYNSGEKVKFYDGWEPRVSGRYLLNEKSSFKSAFNINNQYLHMVSLTGSSMPFDIWLPSSARLKPQRGWQYSLGYFRNLKDNNYEFSVEGYYKEMKNQIEYRQDYVPTISGEVENDLVIGKGWSYGLEFFLKKKFGNLQGWIGYTLARTLRKFPDINEGKTFPARYDRVHDLNIVAMYDYGKRWSMGATFVFASGQAITLPERRYIISGDVYFQYSDRNSYRMQPYNRLDLSITYKSKETKRFKSNWTLSVYNAYNRKNPYLYFIDAEGSPIDGELTLKAKKLYLFPILPSLTWNFTF